MRKYVRSIFAVMMSCSNTNMNVSSIDELADVTAERAFQDSNVDWNSDSAGLTLAQFQNFNASVARSPTMSTRNDSVFSTSSSTDSEVSSKDSRTNLLLSNYTIQDVRKITGLENAQYHDVIEMLASVTNEDGGISRSNFESCFEKILEDCTTDMTEHKEKMLRDILTGLYDTFDRDFQGIDFTEFCCALSTLCAGTFEDRADSIFALFDWSQKNAIVFEDLQCYLTSVFRVRSGVRVCSSVFECVQEIQLNLEYHTTHSRISLRNIKLTLRARTQVRHVVS